MNTAKWIAVDWGTSNLRIWVFGQHDQLIQAIATDQGMGGLTPSQFEPVLLAHIEPYLGSSAAPISTPIICCGMVGAKQGWGEATYSATPCRPPVARTALKVNANDLRINVSILPGVSQAKPADVMRGEETQIAGFLASDPDFFGTICLPGTHAKWAQISAREIVSFRTFMTGEMFALLSEQSVLRHGIGSGVGDAGWDQAAFIEAVNDAMGAPQQIAARLFGLRAEGLLNGLSTKIARARLSGYLIGMELAGARAYWLGQDVALIGASGLSTLYASALEAQGVPCRSVSSDEMTLAGLKAAYADLQKDPL